MLCGPGLTWASHVWNAASHAHVWNAYACYSWNFPFFSGDVRVATQIFLDSPPPEIDSVGKSVAGRSHQFSFPLRTITRVGSPLLCSISLASPISSTRCDGARPNLRFLRRSGQSTQIAPVLSFMLHAFIASFLGPVWNPSRHADSLPSSNPLSPGSRLSHYHDDSTHSISPLTPRAEVMVTAPGVRAFILGDLFSFLKFFRAAYRSLPSITFDRCAFHLIFRCLNPVAGLQLRPRLHSFLSRRSDFIIPATRPGK